MARSGALTRNVPPRGSGEGVGLRFDLPPVHPAVKTVAAVTTARALTARPVPMLICHSALSDLRLERLERVAAASAEMGGAAQGRAEGALHHRFLAATERTRHRPFDPLERG